MWQPLVDVRVTHTYLPTYLRIVRIQLFFPYRAQERKDGIWCVFQGPKGETKHTILYHILHILLTYTSVLSSSTTTMKDSRREGDDPLERRPTGMNADDGAADLTTSHEETVLTACGSGDLVTLRSLLDQDQPGYCASSQFAYSMLEKAATAGQVDTVRYLLDRYPDMVPGQRMHLAAFEGGMAVYEAFLERYPEFLSHGFGHMGDPVAHATLMGNLPFLSFLLSKGADAATSHFFHRPVG